MLLYGVSVDIRCIRIMFNSFFQVKCAVPLSRFPGASRLSNPCPMSPRATHRGLDPPSGGYSCRGTQKCKGECCEPGMRGCFELEMTAIAGGAVLVTITRAIMARLESFPRVP